MQGIVVILSAVLAIVVAESEMNMEGGQYDFKYSTGDAGGHKREEKLNGDGSVVGSYSYVDPNGNLRNIQYKAGPGIGFQAEGDISVDKKTQEEAEKLAELAPKAPVATTELKAPFSPFTYAHFGVPAVPHAPIVYSLPASHYNPYAHNILPYAYLQRQFMW